MTSIATAAASSLVGCLAQDSPSGSMMNSQGKSNLDSDIESIGVEDGADDGGDIAKLRTAPIVSSRFHTIVRGHAPR